MRAQGGGIAPGPRAACAEKARRGRFPCGLFCVLGPRTAQDSALSRRKRPALSKGPCRIARQATEGLPALANLLDGR